MAVSKTLLHAYGDIFNLDSKQIECLEGVLHMAFLEGKTEGMHEAYRNMNTLNTPNYDTITLQHHIGTAEN